MVPNVIIGVARWSAEYLGKNIRANTHVLLKNDKSIKYK